MKVVLEADPEWQASLAVNLSARLKSIFDADVAIKRGRLQSLPSSLNLLLGFERLIYRLPPDPPIASPADEAPSSSDLYIDLTHRNTPSSPSSRILRISYDGAGESHKYAALLSSRSPLIEIADSDDNILASGTACTDNARNLPEGAACVDARVITLIIKAIQQPSRGPSATAQSSAFPASLKMLACEARNLSHSVVRRLYHLCCFAPHWRIGWRMGDSEGVAERAHLGGLPWRVLADPGNRFYADPMPIQVNGRYFIFFEDFPHQTQKGIISFVEVDNNGPVGPVRPVLEENWHLSYPFLVVHNGHIFMIPESSGNREVVLYRADPFPSKWVRHATLLSGISFSDATLLEHDGLFWMFGTSHDGLGSPSDTLSIFWSKRLEGPWQPHALNPILVDGVGARPAGPCIRMGDRLLRVTQDCSTGYGRAIALFEILQLDPLNYRQRLLKLVSPELAWPGRRLHTLARSGALECIDGSASSPRSRTVSRLFFPDRCGAHTEQARMPG